MDDDDDDGDGDEWWMILESTRGSWGMDDNWWYMDGSGLWCVTMDDADDDEDDDDSWPIFHGGFATETPQNFKQNKGCPAGVPQASDIT